MKRLVQFIIALTASASVGAHTAGDSLLLRDFTFVAAASPWLTTGNAAALTVFASKSITRAEATAQYASGNFTDYYESCRTCTAGGTAESFFRLNRTTVLYGSMSYENYNGHAMTGSAFIDPTHRPFDIVEDSLCNPGRKHRDTYRLSGAVGIDVWKGLSVGARADFTAANYAKYKDLRHKNKLMDLNVRAGLMWHAGTFAVGANYVYHRNTETITFNTYGKADRTYNSLINYGVFMGMVEQFGIDGYTDKSREMPLLDEKHGGALQAEWKPVPQLSLFSEMQITHSHGYYGRKSPFTVTYTKHHANAYDYHGRITWNRLSARHLLDVSIAAENLENGENPHREMKNAAGATYYEYYAPVKTANKVWVNTAVSYTGFYGIEHELPRWTVGLSLNLMHRKQTAYQFPYYRRQKISSAEITAQCARNFHIGRGTLKAALTAAYKKGSGEPSEDLLFVAPSDKQTAPATMEAFLEQEYLYHTSPQYRIGGSIRYSFRFPGTPLATFAALSVDHHRRNGRRSDYIGITNTAYAISIGCTF